MSSVTDILWQMLGAFIFLAAGSVAVHFGGSMGGLALAYLGVTKAAELLKAWRAK